ncbi:ferredoxin [Nocardia jiangxiensis]|uniref:ferredoxin n=1 Tax=Nocardia jiangxiensis TaxID=282685 RepID=UPI0002DFDB9E|nr:ferredoxin [Nocardia jiangxiensis]
MKIAIDLMKCQNHAQCTYSAPEIFTLDASGHLAFRAGATREYRSGEIDEAQHEGVEEAIDMCPAQAIRWLEDGGPR